MAKTPNIDIREDYQRNYIINGNFDFWQRGTSFVSVAGATYKADRWLTAEDGGGTCTISRDTDVPNSNSNYSLLWECTSADATLSAADAYLIEQRIEGHNFSALLGKTFTISFYVKSNKTGTYSISFVNSTRDRSYTTEYTIDLSNTWEKKEITLTHDDTGAWDTLNSVGLRVIFGLGVGSNLNTSTLDEWQSAGDIRGSSSTTSIQDTVGNQFRLTQVQINEGSEALPFRRAGRNIGEELKLCYRYYERFPLGEFAQLGAGYARQTDQVLATLNFQPKRVVPSFSYSGTDGVGVNRQGGTLTASSINFGLSTTRTTRMDIQNFNVAGLTIGNGVNVFLNTAGDLEIDAEL